MSESPHCINIIDTPGFGDTAGIEKDLELQKLVSELLKSLESIDFILIVNKASDNRVTGSFKWVH